MQVIKGTHLTKLHHKIGYKEDTVVPNRCSYSKLCLEHTFENGIPLTTLRCSFYHQCLLKKGPTRDSFGNITTQIYSEELGWRYDGNVSKDMITTLAQYRKSRPQEHWRFTKKIKKNYTLVVDLDIELNPKKFLLSYTPSGTTGVADLYDYIFGKELIVMERLEPKGISYLVELEKEAMDRALLHMGNSVHFISKEN